MVTAAVVLVSHSPSFAERELIESNIVTSLTGIWIDEDEAQFSRRHGVTNDDLMGGVEQLIMEWMGDDDDTLRLEGRAMVDDNDYLLKLGFDKPDQGYVSVGYEEFRTYYDGSGGFFPPSGAFIELFDENLELDRGRSWFEAGIRVPNVPALTVRFEHLFRDGQKSSTIWGDSRQTAGLGTRAFAPAFRDVDEKRDILELKISHVLPELKDTEVGLGFTYESSKIDDSLNLARRPGEVGQERFVTQSEDVDTDVYSFHAYSSTPLADGRTRISTSYAYTNLKNDLGGSRIYGDMWGAAFDPALANRQTFDGGFLDLSGRSELRRHVGTVSWMNELTEDLRMTVSVRGEGSSIEGDSAFTQTNVGFPPGLVTATEDFAVDSDSTQMRVAERFELRHTGIENLVLYFRGEFEQADIDLDERQVQTATSAVDLLRKTDTDVDRRKYTAGAIWYPHSRVNVAGRYRYDVRDTDYTHKQDSTSDNTSNNRFPAYIVTQDITTQSGDVRASWRALDMLRLTLRYDIAYTEISNESEGLRDINAGEILTNSYGASANWTPVARMYVQADGAYVDSSTDTPADGVGGSIGDAVPDFDNDYWNAALNIGVALDDHTDLETRYFYYRADNYKDNSLAGQPYGSDAEEHGASVSVRRQWTEDLATQLRYAYFNNDEKLSGGFDDYEMSAVTGSLEVKF
jgi:hypothetical protein